MKNLTLKIAALAAVLLVPAACSALTAEEIIDKMLAAYKDKVSTVRCELEQTLFISEMESVQKMKGTLTLKKPDKFFVEYNEPMKQLVKCNGKTMWLYFPATKQVIVQDAEDLKNKENILFGFTSFAEKLKKDYTNKAPEDPGSDKVYTIESAPKGEFTEFTKLIFQVDRETYLPVKISVYTSDTDYIAVSFSNMKINDEVRDEVFDFKMPEDAVIISSPMK
jgi:outer membrane lipoprotein carrier protein